MSNTKVAVVLAAGDGTRTGLNMPKCLIDINGKTIIERLYEIIEPYVDTIVLVIGYKAEEVKAKTAHLKKLVYIENPEYATTETYYSLFLTKEYAKHGFYLIDGDMVFKKEIFESLAKRDDEYYSNFAVVDFSTKPDVGVICTEYSICAIGKEVKHPNAESLNIFRFNKSAARVIFTHRFVQDVKAAFYEESFKILGMNISITPIEAVGEWVEIDNSSDLEAARRLFK